MKRILVIGSSCAGKTTFAKRLSLKLQIPHVELDALYWEAGWVEAADDVFKARVRAALEETWIVDGNYRSKVKDILWTKADTVVWLDPSLPVILYRFLKRSIRRTVTGEMLWGGCKESLRNSIFKRDSLLAWILSTHRQRKRDYAELLRIPSANITAYHLQNSRQIDAFFQDARLSS